jgi:hypothetical protein
VFPTKSLWARTANCAAGNRCSFSGRETDRSPSLSVEVQDERSGAIPPFPNTPSCPSGGGGINFTLLRPLHVGNFIRNSLKETVITSSILELEACELVGGFWNLRHDIFLRTRGKGKGKECGGNRSHRADLYLYLQVHSALAALTDDLICTTPSSKHACCKLYSSFNAVHYIS